MKNLGCNLIVVLGHTHCGAIKAALSNDDSAVPPLMQSILSEIRSGISKTDDHVVATKENVVHTQKRIRTESSAIQNALGAKGIAVVGGLYDIETGKVDFF